MEYELNPKPFEVFPNITTERLSLRSFTEGDAHDLFALRSNESVMKYMDISPHKSSEDSMHMIRSICDDYKGKKGLNWAICEAGSKQMIGYVSFWRILHEHSRAEIGYALRPAFWRQGIAKEALLAIIEFGFETLRLHSVFANVNPSNVASIILLKKLGFVKEAYFRENYLFNGKFLDSVVYSLLESDYAGV